MTSSRSSAADLDDRLASWRLDAASTAELRGALAMARPGLVVPPSWGRRRLLTVCEAAGVDPRPVSRRH